MGESNALFDLIQSLSKNEKGYFKKYASLNSAEKTTNYLLLFDAIASQKVYDEKTVKHLLKKEITPVNFSRVKNYLYQLLLKSLSAYHANATIELQLRKNLHFAEILFHKSLYDQCEKMLNKTEAMAVKFGIADVQIAVYKWRLRVMSNRSFKGVNKNDMNGLYQKQIPLTEQIKKEITYHHLNTSFAHAIKKTVFTRNKDALAKTYNHIIEHPLLQNEGEAASIETKLLLYKTLGLYHFIVQNYRLSLISYEKNFQIFKKYPELINEKTGHYLDVLSNLIASHIMLKEYHKAAILIATLERTKTKGLHYEARIFLTIYSRKLALFLESCQFKKAVVLIPGIEEGLKKYARKISILDVWGFSYNIACVYLVMGEYKKVPVWLNKIIVHPVTNASLDVQSFARILNLITHYEMENRDHLPYIIRSTYQFLLKRERLFEFEKQLLRLLKKLQHIADEAALKMLLSEFKEEISVLKNDPDESIVFQYFDFISWLERKIQNRPMIEIMKEKLK